MIQSIQTCIKNSRIVRGNPRLSVTAIKLCQ